MTNENLRIKGKLKKDRGGEIRNEYYEQAEIELSIEELAKQLSDDKVRIIFDIKLSKHLYPKPQDAECKCGNKLKPNYRDGWNIEYCGSCDKPIKEPKKEIEETLWDYLMDCLAIHHLVEDRKFETITKAIKHYTEIIKFISGEKDK